MADELRWDDVDDGNIILVADDDLELAALGVGTVQAASAYSVSPVPDDHPWKAAGYRDPVPQRLWTSRNVETLRRWHVQELKRRINAWRFRRTRDR